MDIRRILCPVDFSDTSDKALSAATDLAQRLGAKLTLVHAYNLPAYALPDGAFVASPDFAVRVQDESHKQLDTLALKLRERGVEVDEHVVEGPAASEIVRLANDLHADLIVMGTHGRGGLSHLFLGSVAERVVRSSACPVLTVRA